MKLSTRTTRCWFAIVSLCASGGLVQGCSGEPSGAPPGREQNDGGASTADATAPADASTADAAADPPVATTQPGVKTVAVPQALADQASVFVLADGTVVLLLGTSGADTGAFPWSAADKAAVAGFRSDASAIPSGAAAMLPPSRFLRADLPQSFAADAPPGSCSLAATPRCVVDPATRTVHVPPGQLPKWNGTDRTFMGPNVAGALLTVSKVEVQSDAVVLYGKTATLSDIFSKMTVQSKSNPAADSDGFVGIQEKLVYDFSGKKLYAQGPVTLSIKSGHFAATPSFKTSLHMNGLALADAQLAVRGDIDVSSELDLTVSGAVAANFKKDLSATLYEAEAPLPTMMIGPVPIPQAVKVALVATCSIEAQSITHVTAGASFRQSVTVGGGYADGKFSNLSSIGTPTLTAVTPTISGKSSTKAACSVTSRFSILYFGAIGPYVSLSAAASFNGVYAPPVLNWDLSGAIVGSAAIDTAINLPGFGPVGKVISSAIPTNETVLFNKSFALASGKVN